MLMPPQSLWTTLVRVLLWALPPWTGLERKPRPSNSCSVCVSQLPCVCPSSPCPSGPHDSFLSSGQILPHQILGSLQDFKRIAVARGNTQVGLCRATRLREVGKSGQTEPHNEAELWPQLLTSLFGGDWIAEVQAGGRCLPLLLRRKLSIVEKPATLKDAALSGRRGLDRQRSSGPGLFSVTCHPVVPERRTETSTWVSTSSSPFFFPAG